LFVDAIARQPADQCDSATALHRVKGRGDDGPCRPQAEFLAAVVEQLLPGIARLVESGGEVVPRDGSDQTASAGRPPARMLASCR